MTGGRGVSGSARDGGLVRVQRDAEVARRRVVSIQRARVLAAAAGVVDELGYAETSVASIVERARVSRRTFYELFANREACLVAVLQDALARVGSELERVGVRRLVWRERLRVGLGVVLGFLDREPVLARVCVVQTLAGGALLAARREELLERLAGVVDDGRRDGARGAQCSPLTAEGVVGAAFAIVHARLARGGGSTGRADSSGQSTEEPLVGLVGELMALIVLPYLGPAAARRERERPLSGAAASVPAASIGVEDGGAAASPAFVGDPLEGVAMRLTYRTARVLEGVQDHPGASNRKVAEHAGIGDPGQVSKLLHRLAGLGLLENASPGHEKGEPNQWRLTAKGTRVAAGIRIDTPHAHPCPPAQSIARPHHTGQERRAA